MTLCELYAWYFRMALGGEGQEKAKAALASSSWPSGRSWWARAGPAGLPRAGQEEVRVLTAAQAPEGAGRGPHTATDGPVWPPCSWKETLAPQPPTASPTFVPAGVRRRRRLLQHLQEAIFTFFTEGGVSWPRLGFLTHFGARPRGPCRPRTGGSIVFLRFLSGLLSPRVTLLAGSLLDLGRAPGPGPRWPSALQLSAPDVAVCARAINALHCLRELQHTELTPQRGGGCGQLGSG